MTPFTGPKEIGLELNSGQRHTEAELLRMFDRARFQGTEHAFVGVLIMTMQVYRKRLRLELEKHKGRILPMGDPDNDSS